MTPTADTPTANSSPPANRTPDVPTADTPTPNTPAARHTPDLATLARADVAAVLGALNTTRDGLTQPEAARRADAYGPNEFPRPRRRGWAWRLLIAARNPLVLLLAALAITEFATGDPRAGTVMTAMVLLGVALRFGQEQRAVTAAARLECLSILTATATRDGQARTLPFRDLVPGDLLALSAGDLVPADVRLLSAKDLFVIQSRLTGESLPVEKFDAPETRTGTLPPTELSNSCLMGTSVETGSATAVVVATGPATYLGGVVRSIADQPPPTAFDQGIARFTWLMLRLTAVMVPLVFLINGLTKHDWREAFVFALAVAVGMTPEMLPAIVSACLARGALAMSRAKVIVKQLDAIQNVGAMDVLCTDKTSTLTLDRVTVERHCDVVCRDDDAVLLDAYLISHFQTGLKNVLDRAILDHHELHAHGSVQTCAKVDEVPFDFKRRMMSVVIRAEGGALRLLAKGAPEAVFARASRFELDGEVAPIDPAVVEDLEEEHQRLELDGFRVLAVAYKDLPPTAAGPFTAADERDLILKGYVAFLDPPKETAAPALAALRQHGVTVKVLTGDNDLVAAKVCRDVGLPADAVLLGAQVEGMSDADLARAAGRTTLFARLAPHHKQRLVAALRASGHVVGFLGDGTNDAPALRAADVGISVDTAVDIARDSADLILLEKSLLVLDQGVIEGRKVFANILKYVRMGASSNFGNMLSVLGASAFLPFVPMAPIQVLANNLLYDVSQVAITTDTVDAAEVARPRPWHVGDIRRYILSIGPVSSAFDFLTFLILLYVFNCAIADAYHVRLFRTGWFVESLVTQTLVIHVIRTARIPFLQSRPSWPLVVSTALIVAVAIVLPASPVGRALGFTPLPPLYWPLLALTVLTYLAVTQLVKTLLARSSARRQAAFDLPRSPAPASPPLKT
jgi:Mg2+-importing ATPase